MNVRHLDSSGMSGKSEATWASVNTLSSYGYALSAEPIELAKIPAGKATGSEHPRALTTPTAWPLTAPVASMFPRWGTIASAKSVPIPVLAEAV